MLERINDAFWDALGGYTPEEKQKLLTEDEVPLKLESLMPNEESLEQLLKTAIEIRSARR